MKVLQSLRKIGQISYWPPPLFTVMDWKDLKIFSLDKCIDPSRWNIIIFKDHSEKLTDSIFRWRALVFMGHCNRTARRLKRRILFTEKSLCCVVGVNISSFYHGGLYTIYSIFGYIQTDLVEIFCWFYIYAKSWLMFTIFCNSPQ